MGDDPETEKVEVLKRVDNEWVAWDHKAEKLPAQITSFLAFLAPRPEDVKADKGVKVVRNGR
jgi:hypothetical protein